MLKIPAFPFPNHVFSSSSSSTRILFFSHNFLLLPLSIVVCVCVSRVVFCYTRRRYYISMFSRTSLYEPMGGEGGEVLQGDIYSCVSAINVKFTAECRLKCKHFRQYRMRVWRPLYTICITYIRYTGKEINQSPIYPAS